MPWCIQQKVKNISQLIAVRAGGGTQCHCVFDVVHVCVACIPLLHICGTVLAHEMSLCSIVKGVFIISTRKDFLPKEE